MSTMGTKDMVRRRRTPGGSFINICAFGLRVHDVEDNNWRITKFSQERADFKLATQTLKKTNMDWRHFLGL